MTDRELLELAAKAARLRILEGRNTTGMHPAMNALAAPKWNPLTDDGDALRLAVKLNLSIDVGRRDISAEWFDEDGDVFCLKERGEKSGGEAQANTRRAIVRAAAAIGSAM